MAFKDLVFGLALKSDSFDRGMKGAQKELKALANTRLDALRKEMAGVAKSGTEISKTKLKELTREYKSLTDVIRKTEQQASKARSEIQKTGGALKNILQGVGQGIGQSIYGAITGVFQNAFGFIKNTISDAITAGVKDRQITAALKAQLAASGQSAALGGLNASATKARQAYDFAQDTDITAAQTAMIRGGMGPQAVNAQTQTLMDMLASGKVGSPGEAGDLIAAAYQGNTKALKGAGLFDDAAIAKMEADPTKRAQMAMSALQSKFKGQADAKQATMDPREGVKNAIDEIKETLGGKLVEVLAPALQPLTDALKAFVESPMMQKLTDAMVDLVNKGIGTAKDMLGGIDMDNLWGSVMELLKTVGTYLMEVFKEVATMLGDVVSNAIRGAFGVKGMEAGLASEYQGLSRQEQSDKAKELRAEEEKLRNSKTAVFNTARANKLGNTAAVLEKMSRGESLDQAHTVNLDAANKNLSDSLAASKAKAKTPLTGAFGALAEKGAADKEAARAELLAAQAQPIGVGAGAAAGSADIAQKEAAKASAKQAKDAEKQAKAMAKSRDAAAKAAAAYNQNHMTVAVTSLDGSVHPANAY